MIYSVGNAIRKKLSEDVNITAITATRLYPKVLPQPAVLPAIIYNVISDVPSDDISGNAGLYRAIVQIDSYAKNAIDAIRLDDFVRLSLQGYRGMNLSVNIRGIHHLQSMDDFEAEVSDYKQISRFGVWYKRENPDN